MTKEEPVKHRGAAAAMRDRVTEDALYARFRAFFLTAEVSRRWNLWTDVPWEGVKRDAGAALTDAVEAAYLEELLLPDVSAQTTRALRSSRGRAWFVTHWSYEEGKHLLALGEWFLQTGKRTDEMLKDLSDRALGDRPRELPFGDPLAVMADALVREYAEIQRYQRLRQAALAEPDPALVALCDRVLADEEAHREFFRDALHTIAERDAAAVAEAAARVAAAPHAAPYAKLLHADLRIG
jgi:acyl-[acyl-carrier-protein] desaturase